jgi:hypothetical protein
MKFEKEIIFKKYYEFDHEKLIKVRKKVKTVKEATKKSSTMIVQNAKEL